MKELLEVNKVNKFDILNFHETDERLNVAIKLVGNRFVMYEINNGRNLARQYDKRIVNHCIYICDKDGSLNSINKDNLNVFLKKISTIERESLKDKIKNYMRIKLELLNEVTEQEYTFETYKSTFTDYLIMNSCGFSMCDEGIII